MGKGLFPVDYSFWVDGITDTEELFSQESPVGEATDGPVIPKLQELPLMQRRRLSRLGKIALSTLLPLFKTYPGTESGGAFVFVSRWGDIHLTVQSLEELAREKTISPTVFSTSVHNAIGGLFSLFTQFHGNVTSLSGGADRFGTALTEAQALLSEYRQVFVCIYEDQTPEVFKPYRDDFLPPFAVSVLFTQEDNNQSAIVETSAQNPASRTELDELMDFLKFITDRSDTVTFSSGRTWKRTSSQAPSC